MKRQYSQIEKNHIIYYHSLLYTNETAQKFIKTFGLDQKDYYNVDKKTISIKNGIEMILNKYSDDMETFNRHYKQKKFLNKYEIGDQVVVSYIPDSQRYIEYYEGETFKGIIFFIDPDNDNIFLFNIQKESNEEYVIRTHSLEREGCHYFGMSRGYTYCIDYDHNDDDDHNDCNDHYKEIKKIINKQLKNVDDKRIITRKIVDYIIGE